MISASGTISLQPHTHAEMAFQSVIRPPSAMVPETHVEKPGFGGTSATASSSWAEQAVRFMAFNIYLLKLIQIISK